jgi:hypothetical protein
MIEPGNPPTRSQIKSWVGADAYIYWQGLVELIERKYPNVFSPDWIFGGQKYGWALRYKKGRSFCTLIPEENNCLIQIVFGAAERAKVETVLNELTVGTCQAYESARTYHDGKWLFLKVDSDKIINDVVVLLEVKRKPLQRKQNI